MQAGRVSQCSEDASKWSSSRKTHCKAYFLRLSLRTGSVCIFRFSFELFAPANGGKDGWDEGREDVLG